MKVSILDVFSYLGVSAVTFNEGVYTRCVQLPWYAWRHF